MNTAVLEIAGLNRFFGGLPAVQNVTLKVEAGERRLLLGPNGAGKTTLFNLIAGDLKPSSGTISLFGRDVTKLRTDQRTQCGVARTYQIITLFAKQTLAHNVVLSLLGLRKRRWNPFADLGAETALWERAREVLALVGLGHAADRPVLETSYGERRRLEIAMALAQDPKILLLDEPLAGLSADERFEVQRLLERIPRDVTIVMIEHDMDVALAFADRITVLQRGQIVVEGTRAEVVADPKTREVYLGH
ncbi:branched-chain amino acid transport system ATP-binding protein [Skermanella aerolata]|uniref:ABC transporter ATP-binding protein n=1 Tax=Skermanella aerolata TaxID=393310 RepID=A0A512DN52_9PROT|nr:ABC transporter ATP-binding protein [Skermanella aerolata]KJB94312.1 ABC transporter [Skermanella aerolata KACC 11604]GEO37905.1 ABC transporter ATP-binding protein [Skermanella aerolata]